MVSLKSVLAIALAAAVAAAPGPVKQPSPGPNPDAACGKVNIIFTGLPPYHPLVTAQGFDPAVVDKALRADAAHIIAAGYNLKGKFPFVRFSYDDTELFTVVLMGPEQDVKLLDNELKGTNWAGTGVGYGVRGSRRQDLTIRLEDILDLYKQRAPRASTLMDYSPDSAYWAINRRFPLPSNCTNSPGRDLGFKLFCDVC